MKNFITAFLVAIIFFLTPKLDAQSNVASQASSTPLETVLNPDGTLNTSSGFQVSVDPTGWRMITASDGKPQFVREGLSALSDPADILWDDRFGLSSISGPVYAMAVNAAGEMFVGGSFLTAGGITVNNIAKWNGTNWSALGTGVYSLGTVYAIAVNGSDVYVGGSFSTAGGITVNNIAKWDGNNWSALGSGLSDQVTTLTVSNTSVYANNGGKNTNFIIEWNGISWTQLGNTFNDEIYTIKIIGTDIYVGGKFTQNNSVTINHIARWNGSAWTSLATGVNGNVHSIALSGGDIYAGGTFISASGVSANRIAKWDGINWSALGNGLNNQVSSIIVDGSNVIAGGTFTFSGSNIMNHVAKWNGTSWSAYGNGLDNSVSALVINNRTLFAGGSFTNYLSHWSGSKWLNSLASDLSSPVYAVACDGDKVYAGGIFVTAGGDTVNGIAKWDGSQWQSLGTGVDVFHGKAINTIAVSGSDVYVGGLFSVISGVSANNIAKWNGLTWSALGTGTNSDVNAIVVNGTDIYVGGRFSNQGSRIAKWNGSAWSALGAGVSGDVYAIALNDSGIYVGGGFNQAGGNPANRVAKWNGSVWSPLGVGVGGTVTSLASNGTDLYVGGAFTNAGGSSANHIAKWNGTSWSTLGNGSNDNVMSLTVRNGNVYAGGRFVISVGDTAKGISKWDGSNWSRLGSGVNGTVNSISTSGNNIYLGGAFTQAGTKASMYFARWNEQPSTVVIRKFEDIDGNFSTNTDRIPKQWGLKLYRSYVSPSTLIGSASSDSILIADSLTSATYIAVECDSNGWGHLGKIIDGTPISTTSSQDTFTLDLGTTHTIDFINYHKRIEVRKYVDDDGDFNTTNDRNLKSWNIKLYRTVISPDSLVQESSGSSLIFYDPPVGQYIAVESDSAGWVHIGKIINDSNVKDSVKSDTLSYTGDQVFRISFVNFNPNTLTVRKHSDRDGLVQTTTDRTLKKWNLTVYKSSISPANIVQSITSAESLKINNLGNGTYIIVEADTNGWYSLGKIKNGQMFAGSFNKDTIVFTGGQLMVVDFVNTRPTLKIRSFKDGDANIMTKNDWIPFPWTMTLYRLPEGDVVSPSISTPESLVFYNLPAHNYRAYSNDSDAIGWRMIGHIKDDSLTPNTDKDVYMTFSGTESHFIDYIHAAPSQISIRCMRNDEDTLYQSNNRTPKKWSLKLYRDSISSQTLIKSVDSTLLLVANIGAGTYFAEEADSTHWRHLGTIMQKVSNGAVIFEKMNGGAHNYDSIVLGPNETWNLAFINFDSSRTKYWAPKNDCVWSNGNNWEPAGVPTSEDHIIVPAGVKCQLNIDTSVHITSITVASGDTVYLLPNNKFNTSSYIEVNGSWVVQPTDTSLIKVGGNWSVNNFISGRSTVVFNGLDSQNVNGNSVSFYKMKVDSFAHLRTESGFKVTNQLLLNSNIFAAGDTIEILDTSSTAISGSGKIIDGTLQRAVRYGSIANYRFESDSTYVKFSGDGTYPEGVKMTTFPNVNPIDFSLGWIEMSSRVDTLNNIIKIDAVRPKSKWAIGIPKMLSKSKHLMSNSTFVRRVYDLNEFGQGDALATLSFRYDQSEIPTGSAENTFVLYKAVGDYYSSNINSGWNLVSLPVIVADNRVTSLFPSAISEAFKYNPSLGYRAVDSLDIGVGYWLKFPTDDYVDLFGLDVTKDTIPVVEGWNMIGGLTSPFAVANLITQPVDLISGSIFGFNHSYEIVDTLKPMKGYWVKCKQTGEIIIDTSNHIRVFRKSVLQENINDCSKLIITDAIGNEQTLYINPSAKDIISAEYELPPVPPTGIFDVRFASGKFLETISTDQECGFSLMLQASYSPVKIHWSTGSIHLNPKLRTDDKEILLESGKDIFLQSSGQKIYLVFSRTNIMPQTYSLEQNIPNPFNPTTTIKYQLPAESHVTLKIFNTLGQVVATLVDGIESAGYKSAEWDAVKMASGVYFYQIEAVSVGNHSQTFSTAKKLLLLK
ncbi:MAG: T9SS type A sorting domain-containing protein [Ignavibacteriales bacterium]|nr:T9SS type A sorting domain-containing protein [Ignavibacteriales bacterium]